MLQTVLNSLSCEISVFERTQRLFHTVAFSCLFGFSCQGQLIASDGAPVAIARVENGIEVSSFWGPTVVVQAAVEQAESKPGEIQLSNTYDHLYFRLPNSEEREWTKYTAGKSESPNAIRIFSLDTDGELSPVVIEVDQCKVVVADSSHLIEVAELPTGLDLLVVFVGQQVNRDRLEKLASAKEVARLLLIPGSSGSNEIVSQLHEQLNESGRQLLQISHNTMALSSNKTKPQLISLGLRTWEMPADMEAEFAAMEKACSDSQEVFKTLSIAQMNFKPSNGTHTPRWNTEHMMGRQLLFFSQIYNKVDPNIPVMNHNPKQNPEDYVAARPEWNGAEEARQMERVSRFNRRFAYLLDGVRLDQRAPGSRWPSLKALLRQMDRHYREHTENTKKKFELSDWPKQ